MRHEVGHTRCESCVCVRSRVSCEHAQMRETTNEGHIMNWNTHRVNIASASVVVITALSLPLLSLSSAGTGDDLSTTPTITVSLPADADTGEGTVLLRPSAMYPCIDEDGSLPDYANACYWDATTRGSGQGSSFIIIRK